MASIPRFAILHDESTFHVTWQCHNQSWLLKPRWAKRLYYDLLLKYKDRYQVQIYSYCFMDNHIHLSGRMQSLDDFSDFFRVVNACFAKRYNKEMKRRGQVIMGRFKSPQIQNEEALLRVMTYIDLNPKRARKVKHPKQNEFSSYHYYAYGKADPLVTPAPVYLEMAATPERRQALYRERVELILQNDWKEKRPYSSVCFIGNPEWVNRKMRVLRGIQKDYYREWQKRYTARFG